MELRFCQISKNGKIGKLGIDFNFDFQNYGSASVGLRYEHTLLDYDDAMNKDEYLHRSLDEWFPTASYSVTLGKVQTDLSYSMKTNRPSFFAMNDAVTYISRYMYQAGNSQLLNERVRDLTLNDTYNLRLNLVAQKSLLKDNSLTIRAAVLDCFQRNRVNEFSDCGYNQIQQNNRFSTHKLMLSLIYRLNATRSKYKGTGAGRDVQARMGS